MEVCIYHGVDLDGYCSGAIWKRSHPDGALIGLDYGQDVPWEQLEGNLVTLVDFCLQPWSEMERLADVATGVVWIDHHKSAIESWKDVGCPYIAGLRNVEKAACELAWEYYEDARPIPRGVFLLGDYDCWRHSDDETMPYQMGMRLYDMDPGGENPPAAMEMWSWVFNYTGKMSRKSSLCTAFHLDTLQAGKTILTYQEQQNTKSAKAIWFPVTFDAKRWMAVNQGGINSKFWDSVWDDSYDGMLGFVRSRKHWTVSLYSGTIDCSEIAKRHGGGGHRGASGFQCQELPFTLDTEQPD